ncbi:hypothetical protein BdWA1_000008 [Babesia duncani]|uniref:Uncharacterized protein n=1 Tax=Babesia duncani TaxID=323732 RepID=A0AAD9PLM3_9APIC|nr:hypothetical protein BdWA1_000008 [Babesia duncani]
MNYFFGVLMLLCINFSEQLQLVSLDIDQESFRLPLKKHSFGEEAAPAFLDVYVEEDIQKIPVMFNLVIETKGDYTYRNYFFKRDGDKFINFDVPKLSDYYNVRTEGIATYYLTYKPIRVPREVLKRLRREFPDNNQLKVSNDPEDGPRSNEITLKLKLNSGSLVSYMGTYVPKTSSRGCRSKAPIFNKFRYKLTTDGQAIPVDEVEEEGEEEEEENENEKTEETDDQDRKVVTKEDDEEEEDEEVEVEEEELEVEEEEEDKCYIEVLGSMKSLKHSIESDFITSQTLISELQNLIKEGKEMSTPEYKDFYGKMREAYEKLLNLKISISSLKTVTNDAKKLTKKVPKSLRNKFKNEVKENKGFVSNQDDQQKTLESTMKSLQKALIAKRLTDPLSIELLQEDYNQLIEKSRVFMNLIRDHELYVKHQLQKLEEMMEGHDVFTDKELYSKLWHRNFHTKDIIAKMAGFAGSQRILLNEAERLKQLMIEETGKTTDTGFNVINEMYSEGKLMHEKLTKQYEDVTARLRKIPLRKQKQVITKAEPTTEEVAEAEAQPTTEEVAEAEA